MNKARVYCFNESMLNVALNKSDLSDDDKQMIHSFLIKNDSLFNDYPDPTEREIDNESTNI